MDIWAPEKLAASIARDGFRDSANAFDAPGAYKHFDARDEGWPKVVLRPEMIQARA